MEFRVESVMNVVEMMLIHKVYHGIRINDIIEVSHYENLFLSLDAVMNKLTKMSEE